MSVSTPAPSPSPSTRPERCDKAHIPPTTSASKRSSGAPDLRAIALESDSADPTLDDGLGLDDLQDLFSVLMGGEDD